MNKFNVKIGTVISGTHRTLDLIAAYHAVMLSNDDLQHEYDDQLWDDVSALIRVIGGLKGDSDDGKAEEALSETSYAIDLVDRLGDQLQEVAPIYCFFGTHRGNGSDYGFWVDQDELDEAISDDVIKTGDSCPDDLLAGDLFLVVNDHGNMTLWQGEEIIWSVV